MSDSQVEHERWRDRRTARIERALLLALGGLAGAAWLLGLYGTAALPRIAREARAMCEGLPDYATLARARGVPVDARVAVIVDAEEERAAERFVCARLALAPRPVDARPVSGGAAAAGAPAAPPDFLLFDLGEADGRAWLDEATGP